MHENEHSPESSAYAKILAAYDALPWSRNPIVTKIAPVERNNIEFFPGHRGYAGSEFPHSNGIMIVANNFSSSKGWCEYLNGIDEPSKTPTWKNLHLVIQASNLDINRLWFTNFCPGAMERKSERYNFPKRVVKSLECESFFTACVAAMKPALIVTLGSFPAELVGTDYQSRERLDRREIGGHVTKLMAIVHTSAWTWQGRGFGKEDFRGEGRRIAAALQD